MSVPPVKIEWPELVLPRPEGDSWQQWAAQVLVLIEDWQRRVVEALDAAYGP